MSHVENCTTILRNLAAARDAAAELGGILSESATYNWFGEHMGDYPLPAGMTKEELGKCEYKIAFPGIRYEIGVKLMTPAMADAKIKAGSMQEKDRHKPGYTLLYDFFGDSRQHDGQKLLAKCGKALGDLIQRYEHHAIRRSLPSGRQVYKVTSHDEARRLSAKLKQKITYTGKMLTICT